jgi:hypothetical protein
LLLLKKFKNKYLNLYLKLILKFNKTINKNNHLLSLLNKYKFMFNESSTFIYFYKPSMWNTVFFCYFNNFELINILIKKRKLTDPYKVKYSNNIFYWNFSTKNFHSLNNYFLNYILNYFIKLVNIMVFNVKWILVAFVISFLYFFISLFYIQIEFTKQIAAWFVVMMIFYLLMSTFNSFLNKYKFGKFTSAIQRFWKRTGLVFWLIEGFLFLLFFYYFLNSSQEPLYMFDYSSLNQELLIQLKVSYKNMILLSMAIYFSFILILNNNFLNYYQNIILLLLISLIVFYTLFIETYQFAYVISTFSEKIWNFNEINQIWVLEFEQNNLRVKQQYFVLCLIAKYWHFIFIFISWFFFLIKCLEVNKINYNLMGYNIQNLLILYVLNLFCLIQWIKWLFKKFLEIIYYW